ncbi:hypothetical protein DFH06DRAFT_1468533 [Mycena polygramma]|nr:hypothetical protein DFH06DRAFT_1468533 [Mycena polygramma]
MHILSALLLCAVGTLASKPQPHIPAAPRTHNTLAMRLRGPANATSREISGNGMEMGKRDSYTGVAMTWYPTNTGPTRTREEHGWMRCVFVTAFHLSLPLHRSPPSLPCASINIWGSLEIPQGLFQLLNPGIGASTRVIHLVPTHTTPKSTSRTPKPTAHSTARTYHRVLFHYLCEIVLLGATWVDRTTEFDAERE